MKRKYNIIKLSGFKGVLLLLFLIGSLVTGFLVFPGWVCMHLGNFAGSFFYQLPKMEILHGILLWCIAALSFYALNKNDLGISFGSVSPAEERIRRIIAQESKELMLQDKEPEEKDKLVK